MFLRFSHFLVVLSFTSTDAFTGFTFICEIIYVALLRSFTPVGLPTIKLRLCVCNFVLKS